MRAAMLLVLALAGCGTRTIDEAEVEAAKVLMTSESDVVCRRHFVAGGCNNKDSYFRCFDLRSDRIVFCTENEHIACRQEMPRSTPTPEALGSP